MVLNHMMDSLPMLEYGLNMMGCSNGMSQQAGMSHYGNFGGELYVPPLEENIKTENSNPNSNPNFNDNNNNNNSNNDNNPS